MDEQCLPELIEEVLVDSLYYLRYPYTQYSGAVPHDL